MICHLRSLSSSFNLFWTPLGTQHHNIYIVIVPQYANDDILYHSIRCRHYLWRMSQGEEAVVLSSLFLDFLSSQTHQFDPGNHYSSFITHHMHSQNKTWSLLTFSKVELCTLRKKKCGMYTVYCSFSFQRWGYWPCWWSRHGWQCDWKVLCRTWQCVHLR